MHPALQPDQPFLKQHWSTSTAAARQNMATSKQQVGYAQSRNAIVLAPIPFGVNLFPSVLLFLLHNLGVKGCKNVLSGGDSSGKDFEADGPFFTYIAYRSFKFPPPIPPLQQ